MFYVFERSNRFDENAITLSADADADFLRTSAQNDADVDLADEDIDFVDDSLLNTAPHNKIERQLLTGDMVGLAIMSGAIIWSAMGAIA
jgi:hypothetical protein